MQWVAAAVALRLAGRPLRPGLLEWLREAATEGPSGGDSSNVSWVEALNLEANRPAKAGTNFGLMQAAKEVRPPELVPMARIDLTIVGYLHRLASGNDVDRLLPADIIGAAQLGQIILQKHLGDARQAEAELNCLTHLVLERLPTSSDDLLVALGYANSAAISDLFAFGRSLEEFDAGQADGVLWGSPWRAVRTLRAVEARVGNVFESDDYERAVPGLAQMVMTHQRTLSAIAGAVQAHVTRGSWCPWAAAFQREAPNLETELEWMTDALAQMEAGRPEELMIHWRTLSDAVKLDNDPMRILDGAQAVMGDTGPIPWKEIDVRWNDGSPLLAPIVAQSFPWHPYEIPSASDVT